MAEIDKINKNLLHLGADLNDSLVSSFREQAKKRKFKKKEILSSLIQYWMNLDFSEQQKIYHGMGSETKQVAIKEKPLSFRESVEIVKHYVKYKIPTEEERGLIHSLRKALGPEQNKKKRKKA